MSTAQDIITGALRKIGAYAPGEPLGTQEATDALGQLNALLDLWSTEHLTVYNNTESVFTLTSAKGSYSVGNYTAGTFAGTLAAGNAVITGVTIPSGMIANGDLSGTGIPAGATIVSVGVNSVTMSAPATASITSQITYTIPGELKMARPLRITGAYARLTSIGFATLDYQIDPVDSTEWAQIGIKSQPGPWPKKLYYDANMPLGQIYIWPVPTSAAELHLWTDGLFQTFSNLTDTVNLPQGYLLALQYNLAVLLAPEYGMPIHPSVERLAGQMKAKLKSLNSTPAIKASVELPISGNAGYGWIYHGGFGG